MSSEAWHSRDGPDARTEGLAGPAPRRPSEILLMPSSHGSEPQASPGRASRRPPRSGSLTGVVSGDYSALAGGDAAGASSTSGAAAAACCCGMSKATAIVVGVLVGLLVCGGAFGAVAVATGMFSSSSSSSSHSHHGHHATHTPSATPSSSLTASPTPSLSPAPQNRSATPSPSASPSAPAPSDAPHPSQPLFLFWNGMRKGAEGSDWFETLDVNANKSFLSHSNGSAYRVQVDWDDHNAIQLFANPEFLKLYDDAIRKWNPNAQNYSGSIDECGWPAEKDGLGFPKRTDCFYEDFSKGWDDSRIRIALAKSCCAEAPIYFPNNFTYYPGSPNGPDPPPPFAANVGVEEAVVEYPQGTFRKKNVLRLTAINEDNMSPQSCGTCSDPSDPVTCPDCHKAVINAGLVETADLFSSARYDLVAKVPASSGLVWAMWTFHYEEHLPFQSCSDYGCYKDYYRGLDPTFPPQTLWSDCCGEGCCAVKDRPAHCPPADSAECNCCAGFGPSGPCAHDTLCDPSWSPLEQSCATKHQFPDPQFTANASINSWKVQVNHEIDIEIPANCEGTSVCSETASPFMNFTQREESQAGCINRLNTLNMNNYIYTTTGGTGPAYANMCGAVFKNETGEPFNLIGGDRYRKYTIDWHTGGVDLGDGKKSDGRVDFYVDDVYLGSNNVFVPTRASRLVFGLWAPTNHYSWNNWPDNWSGRPGDGNYYLSHAYVSEVRIQPHNEPNDVVYPASYDQPDGCQPFYLAKGECHRHWTHTSPRPPVDTTPDSGVLSTASCRPPS